MTAVRDEICCAACRVLCCAVLCCVAQAWSVRYLTHQGWRVMGAAGGRGRHWSWQSDAGTGVFVSAAADRSVAHRDRWWITPRRVNASSVLMCLCNVRWRISPTRLEHLCTIGFYYAAMVLYNSW